MEYLGEDGTVTPGDQATLVRALAFGLVPDEARSTVADQLVAAVRAADGHLTTGFLATPLLLPTLADAGHPDVAYELLLQDTPPAWLPMIDQGATTVWESWERFDADGTGSLNHYSKGAVISFLHTHTAGLQPLDPAYRRFRVAPRPGGGITSAEAALDSPHGRIEVAWRQDDNGRAAIEVLVPPGTDAEVDLPDGQHHTPGPGRWRGRWNGA